MLDDVNRTLTDLRAQLGSPARFHIDAEPARKRTPVLTTVHWSCGCSATGAGFDRLLPRMCLAHGGTDARAGVRALPLLGSLLSRSHG